MALMRKIYQNLVYTGLRNGGIARFDLRTPRSGPTGVFEADPGDRRSSVTNLEIVNEWELLTGRMDGSVSY
jgi:DDB1- and CUL4-associated factor 4